MLRRIKYYLKTILRSSLKVTVGIRHSPDFIVIGAQKGGTTSLFHYLNQHPQLNLPSKKEIHFFTKNYHRGLKFYKTYFPFKKNGKLSGEATPYYLFHPLIPKRVFKHYPNVKLIVMLRNPVDRAFSHYNMEKKMTKEDRSFEDAIKDELDKFEIINSQVLLSSRYSNEHAHHSYLSRGLYQEQIVRWLTCFDKSQMLFLKSEDFFRDPQKELNKVFNFLKIDPVKIKDLKPKWQGDYNKLDVSTYNRLDEFFKKRNSELTNLIGNNFNW